MVNKTMEWHVLHALAKAITTIITFDIWISQGGFDTFVLMVNYINKKWVPCHITMGIFEVHETLGVAMTLKLKDFQIPFHLCDMFIVNVKDEGTYLNTLANALTSINCVICFANIITTIHAYNCYVLCPSVVNMLLTIWKLFHEGGFNQRWTRIFVKNYYMDKRKRKGKGVQWERVCKDAYFCPLRN